MKKLKKRSQSYSSNMVSSELSALEFKILSYLKKHKKIFLTYDELKTLIKPHFPDDYILFSTILYEKEPGKFFIIPTHDEIRCCSQPKNKNKDSFAKRDRVSKSINSSGFRKQYRNNNEKRKWKANHNLYREIK